MLQPFHKNTLSSSHVSFPVSAHFSSTEGVPSTSYFRCFSLKQCTLAPIVCLSTVVKYGL